MSAEVGLREAVEALADDYARNGRARDAAGKPAWPNNVARDLRAALAAHPAPSPAVPNRRRERCSDNARGLGSSALCICGPNVPCDYCGQGAAPSPAVPPAPTLAGLTDPELDRLGEFAHVMRLLPERTALYRLIQEVERILLAHLSPPTVPDRDALATAMCNHDAEHMGYTPWDDAPDGIRDYHLAHADVVLARLAGGSDHPDTTPGGA